MLSQHFIISSNIREDNTMAINQTPSSIAPGSLEAWEYLASYVDLRGFYGTDTVGAAQHYTLFGISEGRSITFDAWVYMASHDDLLNFYGTTLDAMGAASHYVILGAAEGRATETFDAIAYINDPGNADLLAAFGGDADGGRSHGAEHYVTFGRGEIANGLRDSSGQAGQTFMLTEGQDFFPGGLDNNGNDSLIAKSGTLTPGDDLDGGPGNDSLTLTGMDTLRLSETMQVKDIEHFIMTTGNTIVEVAGSMITSITGLSGRLTVDMGSAGNTVDITDVTLNSNNLLTINGSGGHDLVIADEATVDAKTTMTLGDAPGDINDTLRVVDGATITAEDMGNISGVDVLELVSDSSLPQTWNITVPSAAVGGNGLLIRVDSTVPQGSVVNIINPDGVNITVDAGSNVTVNNNNDGGGDTGQTAGDFTGGQDNLVGTAGDDTFAAAMLSYIQSADTADGLDGIDTLRIDFPVNEGSQTLEALFDHADIQSIERLEFNTRGIVSFQANRTDPADLSPGGDYDFHTFVFGVGNNVLYFGGATAQSYTVEGARGNDTIYDNFDWTGDGIPDGGNTAITFNGGGGSDNFIFGDDTVMTPADLFAPGGGIDTVTVYDTTEVDVDRGEIAALVTDGELERFVADSDVFVDIFLNNADLYDFTGGVAVFDLDAGVDVFISASAVTDPSESIHVTINAGDDILAVGGAGDDIINILAGETDGDDIGVADDTAGVLGLGGGDTIYLEPAQAQNDYVVYKTPQDGGPEGQNGGAGINDVIYNFDISVDEIVFSKSTIGGLPGLARYTDVAETGSGWMGDTLDKNGDDIVDAVTDPLVAIDLAVDELAVFTGTGLSDADLLDLTAIAGLINGTGLDNDVAGSQIVFSVQGSSDTGLYSFTSDGVNGDVEVAELSLMAVIDDALLSGDDYHYA